jgi:hypothetical protein
VSVAWKIWSFPLTCPRRRTKIRCSWRSGFIKAAAAKFIRCPLRIASRKSRGPKWKAVWIENEFLRAMVLPEIGGRIHALQDKTNGYDLIYNQPSSNRRWSGWPARGFPAASNSTGRSIIARHVSCRWISKLRNHADGSKTIWCSDHDPMCRMKGMHGVCLHPGKSFLELKVAPTIARRSRRPFCGGPTSPRACMRRIKAFSAGCLLRGRPCAPFDERISAGQGRYYGVNYGERGRQRAFPRRNSPPVRPAPLPF